MSRKKILPKENLELTVTGLSSHGEGVSRYAGKVIFIDNGLPGEKCKINILHEGRKLARATVIELLESSTDRVEPPCRYYINCGGCQLQHYQYSKQLAYKRQTVKDAFRYIGNLDIEPLPVIASEPYAYRNKMVFSLTVENQEIRISLHPRNSYKKLIPLGNCLLLEKGLQNILPRVINEINAIFQPNDVYDYFKHSGNLRYLSFRSFNSKYIIILVMREYQKDKIDKLAQQLSPIKALTGMAIYESPDINEYDWGIRQPKFYYGSDYYEIPFHGITGLAQPMTFLQTNTVLSNKLYEYILQLPISENDVLIDGYCGIGLLSFALSNQYNSIFSIDSDKNAIDCARRALNINQIENIHFISAPLEHILRIFGNPWVDNPKPIYPTVLEFQSEILAKLKNRKISTVILDPPRAGCHPKVIKRLGEIRPKDIIYISCHPATLARDISGLISLGYQALSVQPFDLFPQTFHVETVIHLRL